MLHSDLYRRHDSTARCVALFAFVVFVGSVSSESFSQELAHPDVGGYLAAGEFSSAKGRRSPRGT